MSLFPIEVSGTRIKVPSMRLEEGHRRLRCAILDGEVRVTMPIGFTLNAPRNMHFLSAIDRNHCCQESVVAIATNIANIIFIGNIGSEISIEEQEGVITTGNATWISKGKNACRPICPDQYMFTATEPMSITFKVNKAAGYHSMADNAETIGSSVFFPLNTVHSLIEYVRVLPLTKDYIEVSYMKGMTPELFQQIWDEA